jgi:hypothetical protein
MYANLTSPTNNTRDEKIHISGYEKATLKKREYVWKEEKHGHFVEYGYPHCLLS